MQSKGIKYVRDVPADSRKTLPTYKQDGEDAGHCSSCLKNPHSSPKKKTLQNFLFLLIKICVIAATGWLVCTYLFLPFRMHGNYMFPSIKDGDLCLFCSIGEAYTGDIVLFDYNGTQRIGRIIAKEVQTVDFPEYGGYTIDGYTPAEELPFDTQGAERTDIRFPLDVKDGVFLLNDYRMNTEDSRIYGIVPKDAIKGKLIYFSRRRGF